MVARRVNYITGETLKHFFKIREISQFLSNLGRIVGRNQAQVVKIKPNAQWSNMPMNSFTKDRYGLAVSHENNSEYTELIPFSTTQGPGESEILSSKITNSGKPGVQRTTEKFLVSEKTKEKIKVFALDNRGLPGVTKADPDLSVKLKRETGVILNRCQTEKQFEQGLIKSVRKIVNINLENEEIV